MRYALVPVTALGFAFLAGLAPALAEEAPDRVDLQVGDAAPTFQAKDDTGETWRSSDHVGKKIVVVYFYPADMTPGCTKQACGFRDDAEKLAAKGVEVVGVSCDSIENHEVFKKAYRLNFPLLADEDSAVARKFGVPVRGGGSYATEVDGKKLTLNRAATAARWTFIIGLDGKIAYKDTEVAAAEDSKAILAAVEKLARPLEVGDQAPEFEAKDDTGKLWRSKDHVGKKTLVVYFYPADMTGGCTKQACGFRDDMDALREQGIEVVGVSGDSVRNHQLFKKAHELNFPLLADEEGAVARRFGVPLRDGGSIVREIRGAEETLTRGVTASRWTFVIGRDGKVAYKDTKVNAAEDSKKVLQVVEKLERKAREGKGKPRD